MTRARDPDHGPALEVDLQLSLDRFELEVSFTTSERVTGVFGVSGSGKTSLLESIAGLRPAARGRVRHGDSVWLDSAARRRVPPEGRDIGYVPQDGLLFPHRDVRGNLLSGSERAARRGQSTGEVIESVTELLELRPLLERPVASLSGGERQRVALGRAICSGPRLLLLDEPLASLDLGLRRRLLPFLRRVNEEFQLPSLVVSHDPIEVLALCDDLIVLGAGKAIARGEPREVLTDPSVYPLAQYQSFENVLSCELVRSSEGTSWVRLAGCDPQVEIVTVAVDSRPGDAVLLGLPAHEIMIAQEPPRGISARNSLPATVTRVRAAGRIGLVTARLGAGAPDLTVEVTDTTPEALGLEPGRAVYLIFKATSCRVYGTS